MSTVGELDIQELYEEFAMSKYVNAAHRDANILLEVKRLRAEVASLKEERANRWCPDKCPITGRGFFMWIEHPDKGLVPTYGGPFDSYTIAEPDADGTFFCERYDHDLGGWLVDETVGIGLRLIDDQREDHEYGTVDTLTQQLAAVTDECKAWAGLVKARDEQLAAANGRVEKMKKTITKALNLVPADDGAGGLIYDHHSADGEYIGTEQVDPMWVIQGMCETLQAAISDLSEADKEKS